MVFRNKKVPVQFQGSSSSSVQFQGSSSSSVPVQVQNVRENSSVLMQTKVPTGMKSLRMKSTQRKRKKSDGNSDKSRSNREALDKFWLEAGFKADQFHGQKARHVQNLQIIPDFSGNLPDSC